MTQSKKLTLGAVIQGLRSRNHWTLKEMSERCGIPVSTLSKVEHDRLTLSYDKLQQLGRRLKIPMSELFAEGDEEPSVAVTARRSIGKVENALRVTTPNYDYYYMCSELRKKRMVPVYTRIRAKTIDEFGDLVRHAGEEYVFVLKGEISVHTEFYDPVILSEGQSIYLDAGMGHAYLVADGCEEAITLGVMSSAEDEDLASTLIAISDRGS